MRNVAVGTVKKSIDTSSPMWLSRNALQFCDGGFVLLGIHRDTVRCEMSIPSFSSFPCILGLPQSGLADAIFRIKSLISFPIPGRPMGSRLDSRVQYKANLFRCHRTTVSGLTMISDSRQLIHIRESQTQNRRSAFRSRRWRWARAKIASCCR